MTALFCQCNLLILETKRRTVCASLRKEACLTDIDLLKYQHTLHYIADFCIHSWVLVTCHNKDFLFYLNASLFLSLWCPSIIVSFPPAKGGR